MLLGAKAHALLDGRVHVSTDDIRYVARPVMRHRLATSFRAESDGVTADHIVEKLFEVVRSRWRSSSLRQARRGCDGCKP